MEDRQQKLGKIFIDTAFVEYLKKKILEIKSQNSIILNKEGKTINSLIDFIFHDEYSDLFIDSEFIAKTDFIRVFFDGKNTININKGIKKNIVIADYPFSYYFYFTSNKNCEKHKSKGVFFTNHDNFLNDWDELNNISKKRSFTVSKDENNEFKEWEILNKYNFFGNTIVVFDNFLFTNDSRLELYNTKKILSIIIDSFVKNNISTKIEIMIISNYTKHSIENIKKEIQNFLTTEYNKLEIKLSFIYTPTKGVKRKIHDRGILSNYFYIKSPFGFCLLDNENVIQTDATIIDISTSPTNFLQFINTYLPEIKNKISKSHYFIGNKKNKLLVKKTVLVGKI